MQLTGILTLLICCSPSLMSVTGAPSPQEPVFELPVQLVGFPVIIAAVRISNFVKKLAYSLDPETYRSRTKRELTRLVDEEILDVAQVEKKLVAELGNHICIYENICAKYAEITLKKKGRQHKRDWNVVFSQYKLSPDLMKEIYLLSVFLGDIFGSPRLCRQLGKRGRACVNNTLSD